MPECWLGRCVERVCDLRLGPSSCTVVYGVSFGAELPERTATCVPLLLSPLCFSSLSLEAAIQLQRSTRAWIVVTSATATRLVTTRRTTRPHVATAARAWLMPMVDDHALRMIATRAWTTCLASPPCSPAGRPAAAFFRRRFPAREPASSSRHTARGVASPHASLDARWWSS